MNKIKNLVYIVGGILLIVKIFFKDIIPEGFHTIKFILAVFFLLIIIILELLTRKK